MEPREHIFNRNNVIQYAKTHFLGRGFNSVGYNSSKPSDHYIGCLVYNRPEHLEIHLNTPAVIQDQSIDFSESNTLNNIINQNKAYFLSARSILLDHENITENENIESKTNLVLTFVHYETVKCSIPVISPDFLSEPWGDALVTEGTIYSGFEVHVGFSISKNRTKDVSKIIKEINDRICGVDFDVAAEYLSHDFLKYGMDQELIKLKSPASSQSNYLGEFLHISAVLANISRINQAFLDSLNDLETFQYYINPRIDIIPYPTLHQAFIFYDKLPKENISYDLPEYTLYALDKSVTKTLIETDKSIFGIRNSREESTSIPNQEERGIHLRRLFECMYSILGRTITESESYVPEGMMCIMVMGQSRIGKSAILGDILGHPLVLRAVENGEYRLEYFNEHSRTRRPVIGHKDISQTKGCYVYLSEDSRIACIDCAGILDTQEAPEVDICNAMAVDIMMKSQSPTALLVLVKARWILEPGMITFIGVINRLKRMLPPDLHAWESVIFILNDIQSIADPCSPPRRPSFLNKDEIKTMALRKIEEYIELLENEISDLRQIVSDNDTGVDEVIQKKAILETLLNYRENFIVTKYDETPTASIREEVFDVLNREDRLPLSQFEDKFRIESFYEDRTSHIKLKFYTALKSLANSFSSIIFERGRYITTLSLKIITLKCIFNEFYTFTQPHNDREVEDLLISLHGIESILESYLPFIELTYSLIGIFNLLDSPEYHYTQIHKFLINFPEKIFNTHLTSNVNELMRTGHRFQTEHEEGLPLGRNALTIETLQSPEPTQDFLNETRTTLEERLSNFRARIDISSNASSWRVESDAFLVAKMRRELAHFGQTIKAGEEKSNESTYQESCIIS